MEVNNQDIMEAFREVTPTAMREVYIESPNVHWDEVGGLEDVKQRQDPPRQGGGDGVSGQLHLNKGPRGFQQVGGGI
jgi:hypothetical protein